jgi:hypothetical protein
MNLLLAERFYSLLLRFYPPKFRVEFEKEMEDVFWQSLQAADSSSSWIRLLLHELRDWPGAVLNAYQDERSQDMPQRNGFNLFQGRVLGAPASWRRAWLPSLAGVWIFILLGPLVVASAYPYPTPVWHNQYRIPEVLTILTLVSLLAGVGVGVWRKFPRWCFPYLTILVMISGLPLLLLISEVLLPQVYNHSGPFSGIFQIATMAFSYAVSLGIILLLARYWRPLKPLSTSLRSDWTQLSFGLFILMTWLFGQIDHDEDPFLTIAVILPVILLALGALGYMRSRWRYQQWLSLGGSLGAAMLVRIVNGDWFYAFFAIPLVILVFLPPLLLIRDQTPPPIASQ